MSYARRLLRQVSSPGASPLSAPFLVSDTPISFSLFKAVFRGTLKGFTTKAIPDNAYAVTEFADEQSEEYCRGVKAHGCVELCIMGGKNTLPIRKN